MRPARAALVCAALAGASLCTPRNAGAPAAASADEERRAALYREGVDLANGGRWEEAVKKFREVVAIRSAPPALFTLAQAEEHVGQLATAERTYERALVDARTSGATDVASAAQKSLAAIEPRVPRVIVRLAAPTPGASVTLDAGPVKLGEPTKVDPGDHAIAGRAPGKQPFDTKVHLAEGQSLDVAVVLEAIPPPPPPPPAPAPTPPPAPPPAPETKETTSSGHFPVGPVILGGAGIAAGVVGLVVRLTGQSSYDSASAQCGPAGCPTQQAVDDGNSARTQILVGTVVLGVGVAAVVGAGVWWALTPRPPAGETSAGVSFGVAPEIGGARAGLGGRF